MLAMFLFPPPCPSTYKTSESKPRVHISYHKNSKKRSKTKPISTPGFPTLSLPFYSQNNKKELTFGAGFVNTRYNPTPPNPTESQYNSPLFARFSFLPFILHHTDQQRGGAHSRVALLEILLVSFFLSFPRVVMLRLCVILEESNSSLIWNRKIGLYISQFDITNRV